MIDSVVHCPISALLGLPAHASTYKSISLAGAPYHRKALTCLSSLTASSSRDRASMSVANADM